MDAGFFFQVRDAVEGSARRVGSDLHLFAHGRGVKLWFGTAVREHFEAQLIGIDGRPMLEIGFHAEHPVASTNDEVLGRLLEKRRLWRSVLGSAAEAGPFLGRRGWIRISECWDVPPATIDVAIEIAARLAEYVVVLEDLRKVFVAEGVVQ